MNGTLSLQKLPTWIWDRELVLTIEFYDFCPPPIYMVPVRIWHSGVLCDILLILHIKFVLYSRPDAIYVSKSISTFFCVHIFCKDFWRGGNNLEAYPPYPDRNIVQGSRNGKIIQWQMCDKSSDFCQNTSEVKINIFGSFCRLLIFFQWKS